MHMFFDSLLNENCRTPSHCIVYSNVCSHLVVILHYIKSAVAFKFFKGTFKLKFLIYNKSMIPYLTNGARTREARMCISAFGCRHNSEHVGASLAIERKESVCSCFEPSG